MTFTVVSLSSSRRQRTKAFRAALDAEYAESPIAGTIAMLDPVLELSGYRLLQHMESVTY